MKILSTGKGKRLLCIILAVVLMLSVAIVPGITASAATTASSLLLSEHGINAHKDGWLYVYGGKGQTQTKADGTKVRVSDCAGLIYAFFSDMGMSGCMGGATSQVNYNCIFSNDISEGIPRIHGLVLTMPNKSSGGIYGHIGIYIGNNEVTDNSDSYYNMMRGPVIGSSRNWTAWHLFDNGLKYPSNGWYEMDGKMYHYSNYEYQVDTVVDGYFIGNDGVACDADGNPLPVDESMLSNSYVAASVVKNHLISRGFSGHDSTSTIVNGGTDDPAFNGTVNVAAVNVRSSASTSSNIVTQLRKGAKVKVISEVEGEAVTDEDITSMLWYEVETVSGYKGYISSIFVDVNTTTDPSSPLTAPVISCSDGYVSITAGGSADIYYTVDGTDPDANSTPYTGPVYMTGYTYKAVAIKNGVSSEVTTATVLTSGAIFTDFSSDNWYFSYVDDAVSRGLFVGNGDGTFSAGENITRGQFVRVLANLARVDLAQYEGMEFFTDVPQGKYYSEAIAWAYSSGIISGYADNSFKPNEHITREQMCYILATFGGLSPLSETYSEFADNDKIAGWAKEAVYACRDYGIISGVGDNKFDPKGKATRAQCCVVFVNF